jgi:PKHD-type hydroxylase
MLLTLPDLLDADAQARAQALLRAARWSDGRASAGAQAAAVKNNRQVADDAPELPELRRLVLDGLDRSALFFSAALPRRVLPPRFNRYEGDANHYGAHVDQALRARPGPVPWLRTDLSCTLFLSDPRDYDGGELVIDDPAGARRIKLPAGHAVLYAAGQVHRVEPVTRGARLAAFFWVESLVRDDARRRLLFDLDRALIALRTRHGDSAETVALTGTYHNLLRQWAET